MLTYLRARGRNHLGDPRRLYLVELAHRQHPVAVADRVPNLRLVASEAADTDLGQAQHVLHRGDVTERLAVGEAEIVDEGRIVGVGVKVDDVQRRLVLVTLHDRVGDGVVAAEHDRQDPPWRGPRW